MNPEAILHQFTAEANDFINNPTKLDRLLIEAEELLRKIPNVGETLSGLPVVIAMVKSWIMKEYDVQPKVLVTIIAAILYFVKGKDLIPDNVPILGVLDDIAVIALALRICQPELLSYKLWREDKLAKAAA